MSYIDYLKMMGDDTSKMEAAEHTDFKTDDAYGTIFFKDGKPLLAYIFVWKGPGPERLLMDLGYHTTDVQHRGNGHYSCALDGSQAWPADPIAEPHPDRYKGPTTTWKDMVKGMLVMLLFAMIAPFYWIKDAVKRDD